MADSVDAETRLEEVLIGDNRDTPNAKESNESPPFQNVSIPKRDWDMMKAQNELILRQLATLNKKEANPKKRKLGLKADCSPVDALEQQQYISKFCQESMKIRATKALT